MVGLDRERVRVEPYDPAWREAYERERRRLDDLIGTDVREFEHVGSTAVEGLPAKPVVDLFAVVDDVDDGRDLLPTLEANGYEYRPKEDESERLHCVKGPPDDRTHYLKIVEAGTDFHRETVAFRDHLRERPDVAAAYAHRNGTPTTGTPTPRRRRTSSTTCSTTRYMGERSVVVR